MMNHRGFTEMVLLAIFFLACFQAEAGSFLSVSSPERPLAPAAGQTEGAEGLTLPKAEELALRNNPLVRAILSGRHLADAQLSEAQAGRWPLLQFNETFTHGNNPVFVFGSLLEQRRFGSENLDINSLNNPEPLSNFRTAVTLKVPLFDQLESGSRIAQARIGQEQAEMQKEAVKQQLRLEVIRAYYGVLVFQARKEVAEEAVRLAEADVGRVRDLFKTGLVVQSDLLAAEVQLAEFRQQEIQTGGDLVTAHAFLNTALGLPVHTPQKVTGQLTEKAFALPDPEELIRLSLIHRPDYARASLVVRSTEKKVRGAWGQYLPRVDLYSTYGISNPDLSSGTPDYAVGASLSYNLFDLSRRARLDQARAAQSQATSEQEHLANQIRLEVIRTHQQFVSARERLVSAVGAVAQAGEALRIVRDRYQEGLTTITEVLRAQTAYVRTGMNLLAARYDYYVGYAQVLRAGGRLTDVLPFSS
jgi:outer membrane protein TolC